MLKFSLIFSFSFSSFDGPFKMPPVLAYCQRKFGRVGLPLAVVRFLNCKTNQLFSRAFVWMVTTFYQAWRAYIHQWWAFLIVHWDHCCYFSGMAMMMLPYFLYSILSFLPNNNIHPGSWCFLTQSRLHYLWWSQLLKGNLKSTFGWGSEEIRNCYTNTRKISFNAFMKCLPSSKSNMQG